MAKPDLMHVHVTASGQLYKDDGETPWAPAFKKMPVAADDTGANTIGVPIGGIYRTAAGDLKVRVS